MFIPILLFASAGALLAGGVGASNVLFNAARRKAAEEELKKTSDLRKMAFQCHMEEARIEKEARAMGVDPEVVRSGVDAVMKDQVSLSMITQMINPPSNPK